MCDSCDATDIQAGIPSRKRICSNSREKHSSGKYNQWAITEANGLHDLDSPKQSRGV